MVGPLPSLFALNLYFTVILDIAIPLRGRAEIERLFITFGMPAIFRAVELLSNFVSFTPPFERISVRVDPEWKCLPINDITAITLYEAGKKTTLHV